MSRKFFLHHSLEGLLLSLESWFSCWQADSKVDHITWQPSLVSNQNWCNRVWRIMLFFHACNLCGCGFLFPKHTKALRVEINRKKKDRVIQQLQLTTGHGIMVVAHPHGHERQHPKAYRPTTSRSFPAQRRPRASIALSRPWPWFLIDVIFLLLLYSSSIS